MGTFEVALADELKTNEMALPHGFNQPRFVQNILALYSSNKDLKTWVKEHGENGGKQLLAGSLRGAFLGLDFLNNECYLIPYGDQLQFMSSYIGHKKLCKKYSKRKIREIYAKIVKEGDEFQESVIDGQPHIDFKPLPFNSGKVIGAFAVCLYEDGGMIYETMSLDELENTRKKSKMGKGGAWAQFTNEMYKKVVLRRLCKGIDLDFDNVEQLQSFNADTDIDTSVEKQVEIDIEEHANKEEFVPADVIIDSSVVNPEEDDEEPF